MQYIYLFDEERFANLHFLYCRAVLKAGAESHGIRGGVAGDVIIPMHKRALIIVIDEYANLRQKGDIFANLDDLPTVNEDAQAVNRGLIGVFGFQDSEITILKNPDFKELCKAFRE